MKPDFPENNGLIAPNVASVPQYSPFRYPGGKSRLYPFIFKWLESKSSEPEILIEPFAGGAHVGLAAAIENMVDRVILVELDADIASVWQTILSQDCQWFVNQIVTFDMTPESFEQVYSRRNMSVRERAFATILRNRTSRGGIIAPGSGVLDYGENGRGVHSRWYPDTLKERISTIFKSKDRFTFIQGDGLVEMKRNSRLENIVFFLDPPYPRAGRRLYKHFDVDSDKVFEIACSLCGDFLITYDDSREIEELVKKYGFESKKILMSTSHHRKKYELLIGRDLKWLYT